jgi:hypothetical protein
VLLRRLARVEALAHRAATDGERRAARAAAERLRERLQEPLPTIPADLLLDPPGRTWPGRVELRERVQDWVDGVQTSEEVAMWAHDEVDKSLLPDVPPPTDPDSIEVEVLLELSTLHIGELQAERDGPALLAFLDTPRDETERGWRGWFRHLRGVPTPSLPRPR